MLGVPLLLSHQSIPGSLRNRTPCGTPRRHSPGVLRASWPGEACERQLGNGHCLSHIDLCCTPLANPLFCDVLSHFFSKKSENLSLEKRRLNLENFHITNVCCMIQGAVFLTRYSVFHPSPGPQSL